MKVKSVGGLWVNIQCSKFYQRNLALVKATQEIALHWQIIGSLFDEKIWKINKVTQVKIADDCECDCCISTDYAVLLLSLDSQYTDITDTSFERMVCSQQWRVQIVFYFNSLNSS